MRAICPFWSRESLRIFRLQSVVLCAFLPPDWSSLPIDLPADFGPARLSVGNVLVFGDGEYFGNLFISPEAVPFRYTASKRKHMYDVSSATNRSTPGFTDISFREVVAYRVPTTSGHSVYPTIWQLSCLSGRVQIAILSSGLSRTR